MPFPLEASSRSMIEGHYKRKGIRWEEDFFLDMLGSSNRYDVYWAVIALRGCPDPFVPQFDQIVTKAEC